MKTKKKSSKIAKYPERPSEVPVTQAMLYGVRDELKSHILSVERSISSVEHNIDSVKHSVSSLEHKMNGRFDEVNSKFLCVSSQFKSFESKFTGIDARFEKMESRFDDVDSRLEKLMSEIHRMAVLMEEQNSKNNVVLDGLNSLFGRQQRLEHKVDGLEKLITTIK